MGVERGVATRMAPVVWPMMIVTVINFEGSNSAKMWILDENEHFRLFTRNPHISKLLPSEALKICRSNYHHRQYRFQNGLEMEKHPRCSVKTLMHAKNA